jgi:hypothetical protein
MSFFCTPGSRAERTAEAIVAVNDCADARRDAEEKCARATDNWVPIFEQVIDDCTAAESI